MLADQFAGIFRDEHRQVRDALLALYDAFGKRDGERIGDLLHRIAALTGPHFRYEEEALYPALTDIFGEAYVEKLLVDHDGAIGNANRLVELAGRDPLSDEEVTEAKTLIRAILPHVSDCEGLSIMVERLPEERVQAVLDTRKASLDDGLDLLQWAARVRARSLSTGGERPARR